MANDTISGAGASTQRTRNPELTQAEILSAARDEFVEYGLDGARIDRIAQRAGINKRMLYHYFGNKESLYSHVLLDAYRDIRRRESSLNLGRLRPEAAMEKLVGFTFDHFRHNPWFVRLLATENLHRASFLQQAPEIRSLHSPIIDQLGEVLHKGESDGVFRAGIDPIQLYITIAGISFFYFSNIHTLSVIFDRQFASPKNTNTRREHAISVILNYLRTSNGLAS
jgi:TetR/AcrR family transcriptional regulator